MGWLTVRELVDRAVGGSGHSGSEELADALLALDSRISESKLDASLAQLGRALGRQAGRVVRVAVEGADGAPWSVLLRLERSARTRRGYAWRVVLVG